MKKGMDNPFFWNYVFSPEDMKRQRISWIDRLWLWAYPTYVQVDGYGYAHHFNMARGQYWLIKSERIYL